MGENTTIEWATHLATHSWNPWLTLKQGRRRTSDANWKKPLKWNREAEIDRQILQLFDGLPRIVIHCLTISQIVNEGIATYCRSMASCDRLVDNGYIERDGEMDYVYIPTGRQWQRPRVFPSLCDPFNDWRGPIVNAKGHRLLKAIEHYTCDLTMNDLRRDMFGVIDQCQNLDFLLATKRPENIRPMWESGNIRIPEVRLREHYRENVWLLCSASDQESLEAGIDSLLDCRDLVPVLGLSLEPLVGPIDLTPWLDQLDWIICGGDPAEWPEDLKLQFFPKENHG